MKNLDLLIASIILAAGVGLSYIAYEKISSIEGPKVKILGDILKRGENRFAIRSGKRCVGEISFTLDGQETITIQGGSSLRMSADKLISEATTSFGITFNPLSQFSGAEFKLRFSDTQLSVLAEGTNPINISATWTGVGDEKTFNFPVHGPLLIKPEANGSFYLEYPYSLPVSPLLQHPVLVTAKEKLDLKVERVEGSLKACEHDQLKRLKLDELIKIFRPYMPEVKPRK